MNTFPNPDLIQIIAADLGVDASFIEKDWYAMRLIATLIAVNTSNIQLVFSGGTSLSKGFGLIKRFSEDLDFKVILPATGFNEKECRNYRHQLVDEIRKGSSHWSLDDAEIESRNKGRFFKCLIAYQQNFTPAVILRPHIRLEITFKPPALPVEEKPLQSFIAKAMKQPPEVTMIPCVSPVETAADKLSALTWRVLSRQRGSKHDDPTIVRHLYDLSALEKTITSYQSFAELVFKLLKEDVQRAKDDNLSSIPPIEHLQNMLQRLSSDSIYADEYKHFVTGMSYAADDERPSFNQALNAAHCIISQVESTKLFQVDSGLDKEANFTSSPDNLLLRLPELITDKEQEIRFIADLEKLSNSDLLALYQQVVNYFKAEPPRAPSLVDRQIVQEEVDTLITQINTTWTQQKQQIRTVESMQDNPFRGWSKKHQQAINQAQVTTELISKLIAQKDHKEIELRQWGEQERVYQSWENTPRTTQMRSLFKIFKLPQIQERVASIHQQNEQQGQAALEKKQHKKYQHGRDGG